MLSQAAQHHQDCSSQEVQLRPQAQLFCCFGVLGFFLPLDGVGYEMWRLDLLYKIILKIY